MSTHKKEPTGRLPAQGIGKGSGADVERNSHARAGLSPAAGRDARQAGQATCIRDRGAWCGREDVPSPQGGDSRLRTAEEATAPRAPQRKHVLPTPWTGAQTGGLVHSEAHPHLEADKELKPGTGQVTLLEASRVVLSIRSTPAR